MMLSQSKQLSVRSQRQKFTATRFQRGVRLARTNAAATDAASISALSATEAAAVESYRATQPAGKDRVMSLLKQAAYSKNIEPETVEGALVYLESITAAAPKPSVSGTWRLVFGTASKFRPFQYIPLDENFVIDMDASRLALESHLGPFSFYIKGQLYGWAPATGVLDFQFGEVDIHFMGKSIKQITPKTKRKTYTWFYMDDDLAAARSSTGGMALLRRL